MIDALVVILHDVALSAGFWGIVLFAFAQEVIPPIPSSIFAITLGFALFGDTTLSLGSFFQTFARVGIPLAIGLTTGSVIIYGTCYWGGHTFIIRYGKYIGVSWNDIERLQKRFDGTAKDDVLFFLARAFPLMPSILLNVFAGTMRWRFGSFVVLTFVGTIIRGGLSALIGWQAGSAFMRYAQTIEHFNSYVVYGTIALCVAFIGYRFMKYRSNKEKGIVDDPSSL